MSIRDFTEKIKGYWQIVIKPAFGLVRDNLELKTDLFIIFSIILIGLGGFGLGRISALEKSRGEIQIKPLNLIKNSTTDLVEIKKENNFIPLSASALVASEKAQGFLVASKSGKKYHFPWCAGASQISDKNKIWFSSYDEARKAGYTPASNCKNLQ